MKGKYGGPMSVDDFFRHLQQDRVFFTNQKITHVRNAFLYFTPCDSNGHELVIYDAEGYPLEGYVSAEPSSTSRRQSSTSSCARLSKNPRHPFSRSCYAASPAAEGFLP